MLVGIEIDMNEITYNCLINIGDIHAHGGYLSTIQLPGGGRHVRQHTGVTDTDARNQRIVKHRPVRITVQPTTTNQSINHCRR